MGEIMCGCRGFSVLIAQRANDDFRPAPQTLLTFNHVASRLSPRTPLVTVMA